jgi:hypothetical protein
MGRTILAQPAQAEQTINIRSLPAGSYQLHIGNWQQQVQKL